MSLELITFPGDKEHERYFLTSNPPRKRRKKQWIDVGNEQTAKLLRVTEDDRSTAFRVYYDVRTIGKEV